MKCILDLREFLKHGFKFRFFLNDAAFNRFDHSIGTGNKKSQLFISLLSTNIPENALENSSEEELHKYFDSNFEQLKKSIGPIEKVDLIAEEIISYMHDCMHLPFSHVFESEVIHQVGFHEKLVKKALLEDDTIRCIFDSIHPDLASTISKHINSTQNVFESFNASSFDLDRFDYILRGYYFKGDTDYDTNFPQFTFGKIKINDMVKIVPIYNVKDYDKIITLLKQRSTLYTGDLGYLSPEIILADAVFGIALNEVLNKSFESSSRLPESFTKLKNFISLLSSKNSTSSINADEIDLDEILKWDNVNLINCLLDFAESLDEEKDRKTIELIALALPPLSSLMYMISYMKSDNYSNISEKDSEYVKSRKKDDEKLISRLKKYINFNTLLSRFLKTLIKNFKSYINSNTLLARFLKSDKYVQKRKNEDTKLIKRLKTYINSNTLLARCLKDKQFFSENIAYIKDPDLNAVKQVDKKSTFYKERTFREYNPKEPIYIRLESGEICTIDKVPGKEFPLSSETTIFRFLFQIRPLCRDNTFS